MHVLHLKAEYMYEKKRKQFLMHVLRFKIEYIHENTHAPTKKRLRELF